MSLDIAFSGSSSPNSLQRPKSSTGMLIMFSKHGVDHDEGAATLGLQALEKKKVCIN